MVEASGNFRIYFAGPDVLDVDASARLTRIKQLAAARGLQGLVPVDVPGTEQGPEKAARICSANLALLRQANVVIANLRPFRGLEPDPGTVFEAGFAVALGIPVIGYGLPSGTYAQRVSAALPCGTDETGVLRETRDRVAVEDFDLPVNLMLSCTAVGVVGTADEALALAAELAKAQR
ncbi:nucleoside 2-deoxyribosyltransferase [Variovorax paradoxus]|uniref:nucleoside 2-deoxyribosyltransferase n=1 Tax=Variovorax paradoxus TaxID=34073 RepID=UPI0019344205|nr:nucleoside 2-deoxyribosyltransferase [Variovorax paradoxus]